MQNIVNQQCIAGGSQCLLRTMSINNMASWLKSAGALNFALSQEQCPISL